MAVLWLAGAARAATPPAELACPDGTARRERPTAEGATEIWCARPDGTRQGPYRSTSQQLRSEGAFVDGQMNGPWRIWSGETLVSEIHYDHGVEHGPWLAWTREGRPAAHGRNVHGKRVGLWQWWHPNGRMKYRGVFVNDVPEGHHSEWTDEGAVVSDGNYRKGKKIGRWVESDGRAAIGRGTYVRGQREGRWAFSLENEPSASGAYRAGKREGVWTFYFPKGGVSERGKYHEGKKDGRWTFFGEGKRETLLDCLHGEPNGEIVKRGVDSAVQLEGRFLGGEMDGAWTDHTHEGPVTHAAYRQGELVGGDRMDQHAAFARTLCQEEAHDFRVLGDAPVE